VPLPIQSLYSIDEATDFILTATGKTVTQAQILDWGTQGHYKLYLVTKECCIRFKGLPRIVRDLEAELRLTRGQAALLGDSYFAEIEVSVCWIFGIEINFVDISSRRNGTFSFGASSIRLGGPELAAFTASIAEPQQTALATPAPVVTASTSNDEEHDARHIAASQPQVTTPSPAPVLATVAPAIQAELEYEWPSIKADISDATRNGLNAAAHTEKHGEWDKDKARAWAVSKGKIKGEAPGHSLTAAWPGAVTRNTINDR
jgi:hypothetical protein